MAKQTICDRCKIVMNPKFANPRGYEFYHNGREVDLCGSCYTDIVRYIETQPSESNEQEKEN